jgi:hypothetical protein
MDSFMMVAGFVGSVFSTLATVYFWFVRMRQERPRLEPHVVDREFFLGVARDQVRQVGVKIGVVVANCSVLPNAILRARLWLRTPSGWQELDQLAFDKETPLPFNIPPMQTVLLRLNGTLTMPYDACLEQGNKTLANYTNRYLRQPLEVKLELHRLNEQSDTHELKLPHEPARNVQSLAA